MRHRAYTRKALRIVGALMLLAMVSGCAGPGWGGGWCYWHPYRCGR
jgi:hypothetical protein